MDAGLPYEENILYEIVYMTARIEETEVGRPFPVAFNRVVFAIATGRECTIRDNKYRGKEPRVGATRYALPIFRDRF